MESILVILLDKTNDVIPKRTKFNHKILNKK